jgi:hypothetical protein
MAKVESTIGRTLGVAIRAAANRAFPQELGIQARGGRHREGHQNLKAGPKQAATLAAAGSSARAGAGLQHSSPTHGIITGFPSAFVKVTSTNLTSQAKGLAWKKTRSR